MSQSQRETVGSFTLKALFVLVGFNFIYGLVVGIVNTLRGQVEAVVGAFGTGWLFSPVVNFLTSGVLPWLLLLFTDSMAFAVIIFLSMIEEAYSTEWQ